MNKRDPRIVIIGAGVAGIASAYTFQQAGFTNFTILEKGSDVGGVWHWNRYPGLTCDVPSHIYQFAFAPKPDWSHIWASGEEIREYHRDVVERFGLDNHLRLGTEVTALHYDQDAHTITQTADVPWTAKVTVPRFDPKTVQPDSTLTALAPASITCRRDAVSR